MKSKGKEFMTKEISNQPQDENSKRGLTSAKKASTRVCKIDSRCYTLEEVAGLLNVSVKTVRRLIQDEEIVPFNQRAKLYVSVEEFEAYWQKISQAGKVVQYGV